MKRLQPRIVVALAWLGLVLLAVILFTVGGNLREGWTAEPPTEEEETDCRIESMMGGENPVEVERIYRDCTQAANDAYVDARASRLRVVFTLILLVGFLGALGLTWQQLGGASGGSTSRR